MDYRYKIEIELDDEKIIKDGEYELDSIYECVRQMFALENIKEVPSDSRVMTFVSNRYDKDDYAVMWNILAFLFEANWAKPYLIKMLWYDMECNKLNCEDVLKGWSEDNWL